MLTPNQPVPALAIQTLTHGGFDLGRDHGENGTVLIFYRGLHCPICLRQMGAYETGLAQFSDLGVQVLMLSADRRDAALKAAEKAGVSKLRIGHGLSLKAARDDWGLYLSSARDGSAEPALFHEPGQFYIGPDDRLYFGWVQTSPFGRPSMSDMAGAIRYRLEKDYPPRGQYTGPVPGDI
jgi:peroxiredoxin